MVQILNFGSTSLAHGVGRAKIAPQLCEARVSSVFVRLCASCAYVFLCVRTLSASVRLSLCGCAYTLCVFVCFGFASLSVSVHARGPR